MDFGIAGKRALVLASSRGLGKGIAVALAREGAHVLLCGRSSETLAANHADFNEPTLGVRVGSDFYFVANSQWALAGDDGKLDADKLKEPVILRLRLF